MIAVRGPDAHRCVRECFDPATEMPAGNFAIDAIRYGRWLGPRDRRELHSGESVVVVATSDDAIEVHCHGGRAAVAAVLQDLAAVGAATIDADRFHQTAASESGGSESGEIAKLVAHTSTTRTAAIALDQSRGAMRRFAASVRALLAAGKLDEARTQIDAVFRRESLGAHLAKPWKVVLAGPPNVGKSSLLNALLGYRRAITFAAPGTTRDIVSADSAIDGWPVRLSDTAGVRMTDAPLEAEGVRRAATALEGADLVLLVIDSQEGLTATHHEILARTAAPTLFVWNKSDLVAPMDTDSTGSTAMERDNGIAPPAASAVGSGIGSFVVSATCGSGLPELEAGISRALVPFPPAAGDPVPITKGQRTALHQAAGAATVAECLAALEPLGGLSSDVPSAAGR